MKWEGKLSGLEAFFCFREKYLLCATILDFYLCRDGKMWPQGRVIICRGRNCRSHLSISFAPQLTAGVQQFVTNLTIFDKFDYFWQIWQFWQWLISSPIVYYFDTVSLFVCLFVCFVHGDLRNWGKPSPAQPQVWHWSRQTTSILN